jgi:hypothetical protein
MALEGAVPFLSCLLAVASSVLAVEWEGINMALGSLVS